MKYSGTINSVHKFCIKDAAAIIKVDIGESEHNFTFEEEGEYGFNIYDEEGEILITSKNETKSFFKKILGGGETIFLDKQNEICRITELNRHIIYNDKTYEFKVERNSYTWEFSTDEFEIKLDIGNSILEFYFEKNFLLPCLCCGIYLWSWHIHSSD